MIIYMSLLLGSENLPCCPISSGQFSERAQMAENHVFLSEGIKDEGDEEIVAEISLTPDSAIW
jgi:hypothetical protein